MPVLLPVRVCSKSNPNLTHACSTKFFIIHMRCEFVWAGVVRPTSSGRDVPPKIYSSQKESPPKLKRC